MGFHKRYIDDDQIIELYRHSGNGAVMDLFTKGVDAIISTGELTSNEGIQQISVVEVATKQEAEAYFAGRKQMTLAQFHNLFHVREIKSNSKNLLLG